MNLSVSASRRPSAHADISHTMTDPRCANINLPISCFPSDLLRRIFQIGVEDSWCASESEMDELEADSEEEELDESADEDGNRIDYPSRFKPDYNPFRSLPQVATLMDCAQVCTGWANAIIDKENWQSLCPRMCSEALAEPWKVGKRWNRLLNDVPVPILCVNEELLSNIGKIHTSILRGRNAFEVYFLSNSEQKEHIFEAWFNLQPILQTRCLHLTTTNQAIAPHTDVFDRKRVGFLTLMVSKWPLLQSLDIDCAANEIFIPDTILNYRDNYIPKPDPPFPALKRLSLSTHVDMRAGRNVTLVAPHVEHFHMRLSGYGDDHLLSIERARTRGVYRQFLREDKRYRSYVTPFCIHAFKWPGPQTMREYKQGWRFQSIMTNCFWSGVLISERRDGNICELFLPFDQFFEVEDLRVISIPFIESP